MKSIDVLEQLEFQDNRPHAQPLYVGADGRVIRFALQPGQKIEEHRVPNSPVYILVLQGRGVFTDGAGSDHTFGPNALFVFEAGEEHAVQALDEPLVFLAFLHGVPGAREDREGGLMAERRA